MVRAKVMTVMRCYAQDEVNQEESEQNEVDGTDFTGNVIPVLTIVTYRQN